MLITRFKPYQARVLITGLLPLLAVIPASVGPVQVSSYQDHILVVLPQK